MLSVPAWSGRAGCRTADGDLSIRQAAGADGLQLINWVAEIETQTYASATGPGPADRDFIGAFADWHFDWLDVPAFIRARRSVLEFPMVDQDPLPRWSFGRVTFARDAAPMVPRGSNGAGRRSWMRGALASALLEHGDLVAALARMRAAPEATTRIVLTNRTIRPTRSCARCSSAPTISRSPRSRTSSAVTSFSRCRKVTSGSPAIRRMHCALDGAGISCRPSAPGYTSRTPVDKNRGLTFQGRKIRGRKTMAIFGSGQRLSSIESRVHRAAGGGFQIRLR